MAAFLYSRSQVWLIKPIALFTEAGRLIAGK
jgi:hypothetical protein